MVQVCHIAYLEEVTKIGNSESRRYSHGGVSHSETRYRTTATAEAESGLSRAQVYRYIRLTELIPELLELVYNRNIALRPAVELSYSFATSDPPNLTSTSTI